MPVILKETLNINNTYNLQPQLSCFVQKLSISLNWSSVGVMSGSRSVAH